MPSRSKKRAARRARLRKHIPNEVLLEIFDSFRQSSQREFDPERAWNSNKGWFKLAHVCQEWRQLVLTSPSRLHVRLVLTEHRSGRAIAIRRLPPVPIVVDYRSGAWTANTQLRMISALAYPDRVCRIVFAMSYIHTKHTSKLLAAMNQPFPALTSLELHCPVSEKLPSPPPFLAAQTPHLRSLTLIGDVTEFFRVLPYTTFLTDLTVGLDTSIFSPHDTQILVYLQGLSSLRRLKVETRDAKMPNYPGRREDVFLPTLTSLSFFGSMAFLDALIAGLAAPSLRELVISVNDTRVTPPTHLTSFIHNSGRQFPSAKLYAPGHGIHRINLAMSTHSHSTDDPPFKIIANGMPLILSIGDLFSETLATVEDIFLATPFFFHLETHIYFIQHFFHGSTLFKPFRSAKILRVSPGIEREVGVMFRNKELFSDLLPALEEIELNATTPSCKPIRIDDEELVSILEQFKPFMDARKEAGHPVKVHWNTDQVLPEYFWNTDITSAFRSAKPSKTRVGLAAHSYVLISDASDSSKSLIALKTLCH